MNLAPTRIGTIEADDEELAMLSARFEHRVRYFAHRIKRRIVNESEFDPDAPTFARSTSVDGSSSEALPDPEQRLEDGLRWRAVELGLVSLAKEQRALRLAYAARGIRSPNSRETKGRRRDASSGRWPERRGKFARVHPNFGEFCAATSSREQNADGPP
jgi:hypothetical protein